MSQGVVSAVINENFRNIRVSPEVREKILQTASALGYRPNSGARAMRTGLHHNIGYFLDTIPGFMEETDFPDFKAGVYDAAAQHDFHVTLIRLPNVAGSPRNPIPRAFREAHLDGLILNNMGGLTAELQRAILTSGFPIVYLNEKHEQNAVYFNDFQDTYFLTELLIRRGYRRITFFSEPQSNLRHYSGLDRHEGYLRAMMAHGLSPQLRIWEPAGDKAEIVQWLRSAARPELVLCCRDRDALLIQTCAHIAGLSIPRDLGLASASHEQRLHDYFYTPLLTMIQPRYDAARAAVELVLAMVYNPSERTRPARVFRAQLREGPSAPGIKP